MTAKARSSQAVLLAARAYRGGLRRVAPRLFPLAQRLGLHIVADTFESPIPDTRHLDHAYQHGTELVGIDLREDAQTALVGELSRFRDELASLPSVDTGDPRQFHFGNDRFDGVDACMLWSMVRHHQPARIVEVGSGLSTVLAAQALRRNREEGKPGHLLAIEPFPPPALDVDALEVASLRQELVQDVALSTFSELGPDDILFIDSSHVLKTGSDVQYLYLEVLPRLAPGVLVHVHDIFLPWEYPRVWLTRENRFWNEQYLLQAFLAFNARFQVVWASCFMNAKDRALLHRSFGIDDPSGGGSFWIRSTG